MGMLHSAVLSGIGTHELHAGARLTLQAARPVGGTARP
jgi:hypothetical protein